MRSTLSFLASLVVVSALAAALEGPVTLRSTASWFVLLGALFGPMYLAPRKYAEWTRRCRLPRFLRPHG